MDRLERQKCDLDAMRKEDWFPSAMRAMDDTAYSHSSGGKSGPADADSFSKNTESEHIYDDEADFKEISVTNAPSEAGNETKENSNVSNTQSMSAPAIVDDKAPSVVVNSDAKSEALASAATSASPVAAMRSTAIPTPTFLRLNVGGMVRRKSTFDVLLYAP
jgi:hypothetical protein